MDYVVSVRISIEDLATIGLFLQESGFYRAAKPSGALAYALKLTAKMIVANELAEAPASTAEELIAIGTLRYPTEQLERQLNTQQRAIDRRDMQEESLALFGASAKTLMDMKKAVRALTPTQREELNRLTAELENDLKSGTSTFDVAAEQERIQKEKDNALAGLQQSDIIAEEEE